MGCDVPCLIDCPSRPEDFEVTRSDPDFIKAPRLAGGPKPGQAKAPEPVAAKAKGRKRRPKKVTLAAGCDGKFVVGERVVEDPYEAGAKLRARVNLAEHPLELMRAKKRLDEALYLAGTRFRALYECAQIGGARGIDPAKVKVDGGRAGDPLGVSVAEAHRELGRLYGWLGEAGSRIVERVCGQGLSVAELAESWPCDGNRLMVRNYLTLRLAEALEVLAAEVWGAKGPARVRSHFGGRWGAGPQAGRPDMAAAETTETADAVRRHNRRRGVEMGRAART